MIDTSIQKKIGLLSSVEAGKQFGYTNDYVARLAREKKVQASRVGRQWFVEVTSFEEFVEKAEEAKKEHAEKVRLERKKERVVLENSTYKAPRTIDVYPVVSPRAVVLAKSGIFLCVSLTLGSFLFLGITNLPDQNFSSASTLGALQGFANTVFSFGLEGNARSFVAGKLSAGIGNVDQNVISSVNTQKNDVLAAVPTNQDALVVVPSGESLSNAEIRNSFSDEVTVARDADGQSGVITPHFKNASNTPYRYVLVPIHSP